MSTEGSSDTDSFEIYMREILAPRLVVGQIVLVDNLSVHTSGWVRVSPAVEAGGPTTVTHPEMIRYFMTIPEAVSLILQAGAMANSTEVSTDSVEVSADTSNSSDSSRNDSSSESSTYSTYATYMLEMGRPVRILELAQNMIEIMGATDVQIKFVGLRPGEKLSEQFSEDGEKQLQTKHPMVYRLTTPESEKRASPPALPASQASPTEGFMDRVEAMVRESKSQESQKAMKLLKRIVPSYSEIVFEKTRDEEFRPQ